MRRSQLNESMWLAAGYNARDVAEYLSGMQAYLNHPNIAYSIRFPGSDKLRPAWYSMSSGMRLAPIDYVLSQALQTFDAGLRETYVSAYHFAFTRRTDYTSCRGYDDQYDVDILIAFSCVFAHRRECDCKRVSR